MFPPEARLIDTNILVDLLRGREEARRWIDQLPDDGRCISVVTAAELLAGARSAREQELIEQELLLYRILWLQEPISRLGLEWYRRFRLRYGVGFLDCLIGATALSYDLTLATLNERHFAPLPDLRVERPY
jgi:predicted nucleic acid-binding protein